MNLNPNPSLYEDVPINKKADDLLGRSSYAEEIAKKICEYNGASSLVVGINGKWGSGKTSLINMIIEIVDSLLRSNECNSKTIQFVRFNPTDYSQSTNIFRQLTRELKVVFREKSVFRTKLGKVFDNLSDILSEIPSTKTIHETIVLYLSTLSVLGIVTFSSVVFELFRNFFGW